MAYFGCMGQKVSLSIHLPLQKAAKQANPWQTVTMAAWCSCAVIWIIMPPIWMSQDGAPILSLAPSADVLLKES